MPGPYFTDKEGELRTGGLSDTEPRVFTVWGNPPLGSNVGAVDQPLDSRLLAPYIESARALRFAIDGTEIDGDLGDPAAVTGHYHDQAFDGGMPWNQIASYQLSTVKFQGLFDETRASVTNSTTSNVTVLGVPFVVPDGVDRIYPVFYCHTTAGALGGVISFGFYEFGTYSSYAVDGGSVTVLGGAELTQQWKPTDPRGYDLSGISDVGGYKIAVLAVAIKSLDSNAFGLFEVQLLPNRQDYRPLPTRDDLDLSKATGDATLTEAKLEEILITNPAVLRNATFGTTLDAPTRSTRHDHGENRGEPLYRHSGSISFGPHTPEGAAYSVSPGLPINQPNTGIDFTITPKPLAQIPISVLGQVNTLSVYLLVQLSGLDREVTLTVEVRPLDEAKTTPGVSRGITETLALSAASNGLASEVFTCNLQTLGDVSVDRLFELVIWQHSNPNSTETYRLLGCCLTSGATPSSFTVQENETLDYLETMPYAQIRTGQEFTANVIHRANRIFNQCAFEVLGGVQGLQRNGSDVDTLKPWVRRIRNEQHQHRGTFENEYGEIVDDGAVIRWPLVSQHFGFNVSGATTEDSTSDVEIVRGMKIHSTGALTDANWIFTGGLCTIPQGLGSIDIIAGFQFENVDPQGRLYCFVSVVDVVSHLTTTPNPYLSDVVVNVGSGDTELNVNTDSRVPDDDLGYVEVFPIESPCFTPNKNRINRGLGCWTLDALRDSSLNTSNQTTYPIRYTQPVTVQIQPTNTGPKRIRVRWALMTGSQNNFFDGTFDANARITSQLILPTRGY